MKKGIIKISIICMAILLFFNIPDFIFAENVRALSLKNLQKKFRGDQSFTRIIKELGQLAGITEVAGYVEDPDADDCILFGFTHPGDPELFLEDFVIGLRNEWLKYAPIDNNTYIYTYPGCSIDPDPKTIQKLNIIAREIAQNSSPDVVEKVIKKWDLTCVEPQKVRVLGIPFDTRFAHVMVQADYDMKSLVDGSDNVNIPGFSSIPAIEESDIRKHIKNNESIIQSPSTMNRFWFYPGNIVIEEKKGIFYIYESPVILLTEEMYNNAKGNYSSSGGVQNPNAKRVSEKISVLYDKLAEQRPIYHELKNLFRLITLAKLIKNKSATMNLDYLINDFPVQVYTVKKEVAGRSCIKKLDIKEEVENGHVMYQFWLQSCGGVSAEINIDKNHFNNVCPDYLTALRENILKARPSEDAVSWDYNDKNTGPVDFIKTSHDAMKINSKNDEFSFISIYYTNSTYQVFCGKNDPVYSGNDIQKLIKAITNRIGTDLKETIYVNPINFPQHKWKGLIDTTAIQIPKINSRVSMNFFGNTENSHVFRDTLLSSGISIDHENIVISNIESGGNKGKFQGVVIFFTWIKNKLYRIKVKIIAETREIAELFCGYMSSFFHFRYDVEDNILNTTHKIKRFMIKEHNLKENKIKISIENEAMESQFVLLPGTLLLN